MYLYQANDLAKKLFKEYGLTDWKFRYDRASQRFGLCNYRKKTISLSKTLTKLNDQEHVEDTIRHEIAHALVGPGHGHGRVWKEKCIEVGANPTRCYGKEVTSVEGKYTYVCTNCGSEIPRQRQIKPHRKVACADCCKKYNGNRYTDKYLLVDKKTLESKN